MFFDLLGEDVGRRSLLIIFSLIVIFLGSVWNHVLRQPNVSFIGPDDIGEHVLQYVGVHMLKKDIC